MKLYSFRVRTFVNRIVTTQIYAESTIAAMDLAVMMFGEGNIVSIPEEVMESANG